MPLPAEHPPASTAEPSPRRSRVARAAAGIAALVLGAGAALGVAACGEDREGSVENIGGATTGTAATTRTAATTGGTVGTTPSTTGGVTTGTGTTGTNTSPSTTGTTGSE